MRKIIVSILLILAFTNSYGAPALSDEECAKIIKEYKIDPEIKSKRGWLNVFKSPQWKQKFLLSGYNKLELDCITDYIIAHAMDVKKYNNYVGVEMKI